MKRFLNSVFVVLQVILVFIFFLRLSHAQVKDASVAISTNKTLFSIGDTFKLSGRLRTGTDATRKMRLFLSLQLPDGTKFFTPDLKNFLTARTPAAGQPIFIPDVSAKILKDFLTIPLIPPRELRISGTYRFIGELWDEKKDEIVDASVVTFILTDYPSVQVFANKTQFNVGDPIELGISLYAGKDGKIPVVGQLFTSVNGVWVFVNPQLSSIPRLPFTAEVFTLKRAFIGPFVVPDLPPTTVIRVPTDGFPGCCLIGGQLFLPGD